MSYNDYDEADATPVELPISIQSLVIRTRDYHKIKKIGHGSYGKVYMVSKNDTGKIYALKYIESLNMTPEDIQSMYREIEIMATMDHPSILRLRGYSLPKGSKHTAAILTDYMEKGSLDQLLTLEQKEMAPEIWDLTHKMCVVFGVAAGMQHLHAANIIHRDLKTGNILLNSKLEPCIADFGLSKHMQKDAKSMSMVGGTPIYMAPELYSTADYDNSVDVYAYGILIYQVLTGEVPFEEFDNPNQIPLKVSSGYRPKIPNFVPNSIRDLIKQCWAQNPEERPTFDYIVRRLMSKDFIFPNINIDAWKSYQDQVMQHTFTISSIRSLIEENEMMHARIEVIEKNISELYEFNAQAMKKIEALTAFTRPSSTMPRAQSANFIKEEKYVPLDMRNAGIIAILRSQESSMFDRQVLTSQSSCDVWQVINPNSQDKFSSMNYGDSWIQFEFPSEITLKGIKIRSADAHFLRSWQFVAVDESNTSAILYQESQEKGLNGIGHELFVPIEKTTSKIFRIEQTGAAWDGDNFICIKNVEFQVKGYPDGIFSTLLSGNFGDPHRIPVYITSRDNDQSQFHLRDSRGFVATFPKPYPPWFQVEFTNTRVQIEGYRLKKSEPMTLKSWSLQASNDGTSWTLIHTVSEYSRADHSIMDIYKCKSDTFFKIFRLVMEGSLWNERKQLQFCHFDVFGRFQ